MVSIKICGITRLEDALMCLDFGVDAIGFIFYPLSPRYITPDKAKDIIVGLNKKGFLSPRNGSIFATSRRPAICGVFVNEDIDEVKRIVRYCDLDFVQLHGSEPPHYVNQFSPARVIKNFPLRFAEELEVLRDYSIRAALVDAYHPYLKGGTGEVANWELAREAKKYHPVILSGGLTAQNVRAAVMAVKPDAIDLNSGVEVAPGVKDGEKIREVLKLIDKF